MASRKAVTRSGRGLRKEFPSWKLGRMVDCESVLECDAALLLESSWGVVSYQEQPVRVRYWDGQQMRDYYPDFEVLLVDGSRFHLEVKDSRRLARLDVADKYRAIAEHYRTHLNLRFRIATETDIRREPVIGNARRLARYRWRPGVELPLAEKLARLLAKESLPLARIETELGTDIAWHLLAVGRLQCDLTSLINADTLVSLSEGGHHAAVLL